ncbi:hypothetical protein [Mycobacterium simiae]|uniref:hypothetical protein n=1 Tax=Mycobacterium simiae TaxID=1784 RepID=UPI002639EB12|nr:hypothetical protein [Mycobacterium simiae]
MTTTEFIVPALPAGVGWADDWQPEGYRVIFTAAHPIDGADLTVDGWAVQHADGPVDEWAVCLPTACELIPAQARALAQKLVAVADLIDRWVE